MAVAMAQGGAAGVVGEGVARGQEGQPTKPLLLPKVNTLRMNANIWKVLYPLQIMLNND